MGTELLAEPIGNVLFTGEQVRFEQPQLAA